MAGLLLQQAEDPRTPEFLAYQADLARLRKQPPPDELVSITHDGWSWRQMACWVKARPAAPGQWTLTLYLEDTAGNRVRTVPNRFSLVTSGQVEGPPERRLTDGEAAFTVRGAGPLRVALKPLPRHSGVGGSFTLLPGLRPAFREFDEFPRGPQQPAPTPATLAGLWDSAGQHRDAGRPLAAQRTAFRPGRLLLAAGQAKEAEAAFHRGWREYGAPRCGWGEAHLLRRRGEARAAAEREAEVRARYPRSVVAQFLGAPDGESWFFEDAGVFNLRAPGVGS